MFRQAVRTTAAIRNVALFACVAGAHLISSIALVIYTFGTGMARFDSGAAAGLDEKLASGILTVLSFPLLTVLTKLPGLHLPGWWGYIPFVANASVWGIAAVLVRRRWRSTWGRSVFTWSR